MQETMLLMVITDTGIVIPEEDHASMRARGVTSCMQY